MREITKFGWQAIAKGFAPFGPPLGDPVRLWEWASRQGDAFQMAAHFILSVADASADDFSGRAQKAWIQIRKETSPLRLAWSLDEERRGLLIAFLEDPHSHVL